MQPLRFATAGSVDDGKSTLIGRLLYDLNAVQEDQLAAVERASVRRGATGLDLSLLTDGLEAEREQGITIDVAYRYFATPRRKFITRRFPGHEQYTRNMATGAGNADAIVLLLDVEGTAAQTRRHLLIARPSLGIRHAVVFVNKMDTALGYAHAAFQGRHFPRSGRSLLPGSCIVGGSLLRARRCTHGRAPRPARERTGSAGTRADPLRSISEALPRGRSRRERTAALSGAGAYRARRTAHARGYMGPHRVRARAAGTG